MSRPLKVRIDEVRGRHVRLEKYPVSKRDRERGAPDAYWTAEVPSLPGCVTWGNTKREAIDMAADAIDCYLAATGTDVI